MEILGLSGYARSGKDEVAKILVEAHGFTRVAFADKLREALYALDPVIVADYRHHGMMPAADYDGPVYRRLQSAIDVYGWDEYKTSPFSDDIRRLLQRLGTEAGRDLLGENIWVDAAFNGLPDDAKVVITDCRFPNEARAVVQRGGSMWRIRRPGVGPINSHESETGLDDWPFDFYLDNDATLLQLADKVNYTLRKQ